MTTKKLLLATLLACAFAPALADELAAPSEPRIERHIVMRDGPAGEHGLTFPRIHVNAGKVVKNAPYSAEVVSERQQNLADGNQITNTTRALSYRDSAGRTRQETRGRDGEPGTVTIRDAEGAIYILDPRHKTATKVMVNMNIARIAGERARAHIEQLRKEGKLAGLESKSADGTRVIVKRVERTDGEGQAKVQEDVRVSVAPLVRENGVGMAHLSPMLAGAFDGGKWTTRATIKDLGTREFDGVKATGKLRSYEIPAGEVGNRNPIVVSSETWHSPELQVTVYSKHSDPRSGDVVFRLENLKREEPAAALFTVPSDYTVKDTTEIAALARKRLEKKAD